MKKIIEFMIPLKEMDLRLPLVHFWVNCVLFLKKL